jgi:mannose/fructose/N-acetylgalactosamine-specific phosphotransferase system component IIC
MDETLQNPANDGTQPAPPGKEAHSSGESRALAFGIAGWLLPGLGHALQMMWGRALIVFFAVGLLVFAGASMKGNVFTRQGTDAFDTLGYIADMGTGSFYLFARAIETSGADVSHADGDYGTRLLATAGVLNLLAALHAYEAARGHKA